jgi:alpha-amylase/alpha-mannosidase (GH57 family)
MYVVCNRGVFTLPEEIFRSLSALATNGFVYLREDRDVLTISTTKIADGRRRVLNTYYRAPMFRDATQLAIVDYRESIRVMAVGPAPDESRPAAR